MRKHIVMAMAGVLSIGLAIALTSDANAEVRGRHYRGHSVHGRHHAPTIHLRTPGRVYAPRYIPKYSAFRGHGRGHYDYHDTTHLDFIPPRVIRHGYHTRVVPGRYQVHRSGHYDYHVGPHYRGPFGY